MHVHPMEAPDAWVLQEKVVYTFQQTQHIVRRPHLRRQHLHYQATAFHERNGGTPPDIVLLSLWPQATYQQTLHYTLGYRTLYPSARVVLLYNNKHNAPAYEAALDELITSRSATMPAKVLLHLFGTSGASGACRLLRGYSLETGRPLNVGAVIADAEPSPSIATFFTSSQDISSAFFTVLLALWMALQQYMWFWPPELQDGQIHQDLNNPSLLPKEARKCFVFAQRGLMLTWMKQHSSAPLPKHNGYSESCHGNSTALEEPDERRAYNIRRSSIDEKGRWSGDQERYWLGIEGVWEGR